ncbi:hypothetical protein SAMN04488072_10996 [Lentibacillus halodurans]|uniref:LPXTG-motif cell wall anchor domain-containing protein n=1 Tax=Lentibacillus halodurans TaxID=237679 RepID=A0A1I0Z4V9_9BACI|nr:hypothetical protein [Lentibacillus halodurans]SFB19478.1 hypothetical protein SAMN04488072_10996 [Lentibacillus halodurans]
MKKIGCVIILLAVISLAALPAGSSVAAVKTDSGIDISITPEEYLFEIPSMKPGDWAPRTIQIQNNGIHEFEYVTTLQNNGGSDKLFHELLLEIGDAHGELYDGKLADFSGFPPRSLAPSSEEELTFTIKFPEYLGNEFQGLSTHFTLTFQAEEDNNTDQAISGGIVGGGGLPLPDTATDIFTYILIGATLVAAGGIIYFLNRIRQSTEKFG